MKGRRIPFVLFLGLSAAVALGLVGLPGPTAAGWTTSSGGVSSLPLNLEVLWLAWFFALWGALVTFMITVGVWVVEELRASEEGVTARFLERVEPDLEPSPACTESTEPSVSASASDRNIDWARALKHWGSPIVTPEALQRARGSPGGQRH